MGYACYTSADLCAVRISLLDADGSPQAAGGANLSAYSMSPISLAFTGRTVTGTETTQRNGCGVICFTRRTPDETVGHDLTLIMCDWDPEFIALATGATVIPDGSSEAIGFAQHVESPPLIEIHAWTTAYVDSAPSAAPRSHIHHVWPRVQLRMGDGTLAEANWQVSLQGQASASSSIGNGQFSDLPTIADPYYYASYLDDDIPDPDAAPYNDQGLACGFIPSPAVAS